MNQIPRLAVLIDAENVSHRLADDIFQLIAPLGTASVRHVYGDFEGPAHSWAGAAARHALETRHCFAPATGKNGADIALTVGAMDLLRDGTVDSFCIVSSDGDFAALVQRIRREGRLAIGIGGRKTTASYREACTRFIVLDPPPVVSIPKAAAAPHSALPAIRRALADCATTDDGWYYLSAFGILAKRAGIVPKAYGAAGLGTLLKATGQFTFDEHQRFRPVELRAVAGGQ